MTCTQVQQNLSLYLYGELDFAAEEAVETHIGGCAFCQLALAREKEWHTWRTAIEKDPEWVSYAKQMADSGYLVSQKNNLMIPAKFAPIKR